MYISEYIQTQPMYNKVIETLRALNVFPNEDEAIRHTIKCMELLSSMVEVLSDADETLKLVHEDYKFGYYLKTDIDEIIKRAKELIE